MQLIIKFSILTTNLSKNELESQLAQSNIKELLRLEEWIDGNVRCEFTIDYNEDLLNQLRKTFHEQGIIMGEHYCSVFRNEEYEHAPLFRLISIGRDSYESKRTKFKKETICDHCGFFTYHLDGKLGMNTRQLKNKILVNVDYKHWVLSEEGAELFAKWGITGYKLTPVKHTGHKETEIPGYLMTDINLLPKPSQSTITIEKEGNGCINCKVEGYYSLPIYESTVTSYMKDINFSTEYHGFGPFGAVRLLYLSKRLRQLLLENGYTKEVRNPYIPGKQNMQIKGWYMDPIQIKWNAGSDLSFQQDRKLS
ncbi:hypothetical protein [Radiobacillus sp. PE A8.2]|uniref:hypothetical protein n=1 Tax=Radiobacillus sp. PE A8.2 TaxID=3380349 RepID=UPI00388DB3DD